ncbi:ROK family protein [Pedobacter frigiditerrae]|uniref:ROK family protein n=1 Tax=Pedobacter frigiditerrae TaxID=2530452 RepID=UPI002931F2FC|nr:ROK family protein [Pedobacter frigiditerrae]
MKTILGVDIGGSHITSQLVDIAKKEGLSSTWQRNHLNTNAKTDEIIDIWANTIESSMASSPFKPQYISLAMPGPMDYKNGISHIKGMNKYDDLYGKDIKELLANRLGFEKSNIHFMNDAASFLQGELFNGSVSEFDNAIGLTLGTGLGTAHTVKGKAQDSNLWKTPLLSGIAEDYISTKWFVSRFKELSGVAIKDVKDLVDNHHHSPHFQTLFEEFSRNLSSFLYFFITKKRPLAVVIGGNIIKAEQYFLDKTRKYLAEAMGYSIPVRPSLLGEQAMILGAVARFCN